MPACLCVCVCRNQKLMSSYRGVGIGPRTLWEYYGTFLLHVRLAQAATRSYQTKLHMYSLYICMCMYVHSLGIYTCICVCVFVICPHGMYVEILLITANTRSPYNDRCSGLVLNSVFAAIPQKLLSELFTARTTLVNSVSGFELFSCSCRCRHDFFPHSNDFNSHNVVNISRTHI